jgi:mycofactocin precursor
MNNTPGIRLVLEENIRKVSSAMDSQTQVTAQNESQITEKPRIIEEIVIEELNIDGVCGVY